ncbi:MAG: hypothetical protein WCQ96_02650 [Patescibacteria group bacterium]
MHSLNKINSLAGLPVIGKFFLTGIAIVAFITMAFAYTIIAIAYKLEGEHELL